MHDRGRTPSAQLPRISSATLPARLQRSLSPAQRVALAHEVLRSYVRVRRTMRGQSITDALSLLRMGVVAAPDADGGEASDPAHTVAYLEGIRLARAVDRTLRVLPTDSRCLIQSLVLSNLLARRRIPSRLLIGVRPGSDFLAHAWIEYQGLPLMPADQGVYEQLTTL